MDSNPKDCLGFLQLFSLLFSILLLVGLALEMVYPLRPAAAEMFDEIDFVICLFFLADVSYRFSKAPSKIEFLKWGWIDFVSSIPAVGWLQFSRVARVLRILRVLRAYRTASNIWKAMSHNKPKATLKGAVLAAAIAYTTASVAILEFESGPDGHIKTTSDALYWSFMNMITVGCEYSPATWGGRVIAMILSVVGVALMGIFTAYVASLFLSGPPKDDMDKLIHEVRQLRGEIKILLPPKNQTGAYASPFDAQFLKELDLILSSRNRVQMESQADADVGNPTVPEQGISPASTGRLGSMVRQASS